MKILMIGAHLDDNEIDGGGLALKYVKMGHQVRFLSLCNGNGGHHILTPEETAATRAKEAAAVKEFLGLEGYYIWDVDDCSLMPTLENRRRLIREIRQFSPDLIITHRPNDYHADHRATSLLVQDASYMLIVPHECPDVPAMRKMPVIIYFADNFQSPPFRPDILVPIDEVHDEKINSLSLNISQMFQWLPYTHGDVAPEDPEGRYQFMRRGLKPDLTDEEALALPNKYHATRNAKIAAKYRKELIEAYGEEKGSKIRHLEVYEICEYGTQLTEETKKVFFPF